MSRLPCRPRNYAARSATGECGGRELSSEALLGGHKEVVIRHGDETYRLRLTRQNKLILTK
ncbi:MAG: hemin uptake protein HemP [Gammaproteobacteria bacterium]|nr:MAG: hemin uptake protein HemP [Gammaproteobacteria bacterium]